ncbi:hypothetical protein C1H46_012221 [Malus baccata]|uniref:Uncharacterized protein n=1 Tax=Malus baccata TaxID=106549 RepID=A0A540MV23_MALBA|nr:hypothetical protein C1H46_012221 [Malus baccata]
MVCPWDVPALFRPMEAFIPTMVTICDNKTSFGGTTRMGTTVGVFVKKTTKLHHNHRQQ